MADDYFEGDTERPAWIKDPETGQILPIEKGDDYRKVITAFWDAECPHPTTEPMKVRIADGRVQVMQTCPNCGERSGSALSQRDRAWVDDLPFLADDLVAAYRSRRQAELRGQMLELARTQFAERGRFTIAYREYLSSPEWQARRERVLARCRLVCEGCGERQATDVHHLTYRHFMNEFLFELVGLCHPCHERWHEDEDKL